MKYIINTLGCKVNQYESAAIETILNSHGHLPCKEGETADAVIVNTCAVTAESGRKSRQLIRQLKDKHPGAVVAVSGCYSQLSPDKVAEVGADIVFGSDNRLKFTEAIENRVAENKGLEPLVEVDAPFDRRSIERLPSGSLSGRTRAMLKIQDGCVNFCTYCIIPYTRGRLRSLPLDETVAEAVSLKERGYREIVLTGIEIASYGVDLKDGTTLKDVVYAVCQAVSDVRIRLGSLETTVITEELCQKLSKCPNLCPQFHLSLQSGCTETLKAMNRKYTAEEFRTATEILRKYFPGCALTADLICGFPGETEENFRQTLDFLDDIAFSKVHIFPYSRRPGTKADLMPNQLTDKEKHERVHRTEKITDKTENDYIESLVGKELSVLFEVSENGVWQGHSENYVLCKLKSDDNLHGKTVSVKGVSRDGKSLICQ